MITEGRGCLTATTDAVAAVEGQTRPSSIVPTPSDDDGGFALDHVLNGDAPRSDRLFA